MARLTGISANLTAFLDMIAVSEGTAHLGDDGYNIIVGGSTFHDYSRHPNIKVWIKRIGAYSTAAGRYQVLARYFTHYKRQLGLPDFSPESQDRIAIQLIKECRALDDIEAGRFADALHKCRSRWASFPGAGYGQHENRLAALERAYRDRGGRVAA
jgi:muramidase (phage lysozyme)